MNARHVAYAFALVVGAVMTFAQLTVADAETEKSETSNEAETAPTPASLACRFTAGERAAFRFDSRASVDDGSGADASGEDHFAGSLSWIVVDAATAEQPALLRASLHDVTLETTLSQDRAEASELEDAPFYVRVDERCRFEGLGFAARWSAASRRLVTSLFETAEVILPEDGARHGDAWQVEQRDGVGTYAARYEARADTEGSLVIVRDKPRYQVDENARRMGVTVQVLGARAEARFTRGHAWLDRLEGRERVRFHLDGRAPEGFVHTFSVARDDDRYLAVSDALGPEDADFSAPSAMEVEDAPLDDAMIALGHDDALAGFAALFEADGVEAVYPAARLLAAWLRAHPEESARLLADLQADALGESARAALFLALELAATDASREVLATAVVDPALREIDRARAASALADHGQPTSDAAALLLAQARGSDSPMVANVSLLGLGSMARRTGAEDPLRGTLRRALGEELARVDAAGELAVVDAIGNTADDTFAPALEERLAAERPGLRVHAANALGHLSPEVARPRLLARLEDETDPRVITALARSLARTHPEATDLSAAELELAARVLAQATSTDERAAMIDWLGRAQHQQEARRILVRHFHTESNVTLQQRIGTFVSARDLNELAG